MADTATYTKSYIKRATFAELEINFSLGVRDIFKYLFKIV